MSTRRTFLAGAGAGAIAHLPALKAFSANDKIRVAVLGVNGRGKTTSRIHGHPDAEVAVICDPDLDVARKRAENSTRPTARKSK